MARFLFSAFADEASPDILEQIAACKANGIEYIELRNVNGKNISNFSVDEAKKLKETLDENGMKVSSIGSHYGKIEITDDFAPHFEAFKNTVEVAKVLEAKGYSFVSAEVEYVPSTYTALTDPDDIKNMAKMLEMFEDNDDVQAVWHNWENADDAE